LSKEGGSIEMNKNIDELDDYLSKQVEPTEAESLKTEHVIREKVTISHERRKLLRLVGVFGIEEKQLKEESGLNDFFFKFHMDFLLKEGFLKLEDGMYRLTDTGIAMHDSVC
jgi:coproporphyrinogen III oxidase-like Fe-S oxidoreductase